MVAWPSGLGSGLQNHLRRFESARDLYKPLYIDDIQGFFLFHNLLHLLVTQVYIYPRLFLILVSHLSLSSHSTLINPTQSMSEYQRKQLQTQLWNIANTLRRKMNAGEFRDYILGFIFYKYLSEKMLSFANEILSEDDIQYQEINENSEDGQEYLEAVKEESILQLGYFLKPAELFSDKDIMKIKEETEVKLEK